MTFLLDAGSAVLALFASLVPVLIWLAFWLFEDRKRPEPGQLILRAFLGGMAAVFFALPLEALAANYLQTGLALIVIWAATEELLKLQNDLSQKALSDGQKHRCYGKHVIVTAYIVRAPYGDYLRVDAYKKP